MKTLLRLIKKYFEPSFWLLALLLLALMDAGSDHYSFCLFKFFTGSFCPGCGLGHAIHYAFHGEFVESFRSHPFGIPAIFILLYRSLSLFKQHLLSQNNSKNDELQPNPA